MENHNFSELPLWLFLVSVQFVLFWAEKWVCNQREEKFYLNLRFLIKIAYHWNFIKFLKQFFEFVWKFRIVNFKYTQGMKLQYKPFYVGGRPETWVELVATLFIEKKFYIRGWKVLFYFGWRFSWKNYKFCHHLLKFDSGILIERMSWKFDMSLKILVYSSYENSWKNFFQLQWQKT